MKLDINKLSRIRDFITDHDKFVRAPYKEGSTIWERVLLSKIDADHIEIDRLKMIIHELLDYMESNHE